MDVWGRSQPGALSISVYGWRSGELRGQECCAKEVEIMATQVGEDLGEIRRRVPGLKVRGGKLTKHGVIAGTVGIVECQQRGTYQVDRLLGGDGLGRLRGR